MLKRRRSALSRIFTRADAACRNLVDPAYYLAANPDVARAAVGAFDHFMTHGWREGRNPSSTFNTLFYRDKYLPGDSTNPLRHYLRQGGAAAGLSTRPDSEEAFLDLQVALTRPAFSEAHYRLQVGSIAPDLLRHYLRTGWRDRFSPSPGFDVDGYMRNHPFVAGLAVSPLYHALSQARLLAAARTTRATPGDGDPGGVPWSPDSQAVAAAIADEFDRAFYLRSNDDVRLARHDPLQHFVLYGWQEGRKPNALFDPAYYLEHNPDVAAQKINPFLHYLTSGRRQGLRPNGVGLRLYPALTVPGRDEWAAVHAAADPDTADVIVVMPVYKGLAETLRAIHAVLVAPQTTPFCLHVVNDATPDRLLDAALHDLAGRNLFSYARNTANCGFVQTVNAALARFPGTDVVLMNADAVVYGDWLDRMVAHKRADPAIATITPFTNNATICSYPVLNANNLIEMDDADPAALDAMAAACNAGRTSDIPVGVGFCLFISRAGRDAVGLFDAETFGRGYGEENDFCLRAAQAGFRNVLAEDIFVYHAGQVSFGEDEAGAARPGQAALIGKHPDYPVRLTQHLEADATEVGRLRLDLFRLARDVAGRCVVVVYHAQAGGIVTHVEDSEVELRRCGLAVVHIRVAVTNRWTFEIRSGSPTAPFCPNLRAMSFNQFRPLLEDVLRWLSPRYIHVHSLVGFDWTAVLGFFAMIGAAGVPYRATLHDYSSVCHRNDLVLPNGRFCGLPPVATCRACVRGDRTYPEAVDPAERRERYARFLEGAALVTVPSEDLRRRLVEAGARYAMVVEPHAEPDHETPILRPRRAPKRLEIVALGSIGPHKGSDIILSLARDAQNRDLPVRYTIVGHSNLTEAMAAAGVVETGRYGAWADAYGHLERLRPSCIFLPSIWPETFCYVLSAAFRIECPPVVFDIGAQAERVRAADFGFVLPYALRDHIQALNDRLLGLPYAGAVFDRRRHVERSTRGRQQRRLDGLVLAGSH